MSGKFLGAGWALVGASVASLALAGCGKHEPRVARPYCPPGKVCIEYGNSIDPSTLDPQTMTLVQEATIARATFEGLYQDDQQGKAVLGLATSAETSADGLTWTFHLRPAKWSDGQPVTAHDFVFAYRRIVQPATASAYAYLFYILKNGQALNGPHGPAPETLGAEAPDDHTLVLHLIHPAPYLPQLLKHQAFYPVPEHVIRKWGDAWTRPEHIVSNGPFQVTAFRLADYVRVEKNPYYYEADKVCADRVDFLPLSEAVSAERRVKRGELDVNDTVQSGRIPFLRQPGQMPRFVHTHTYLSTSYVIFNTHVPALAMREVRQALSMTIDRDFITAKLMRAGQIPAYSFVPPGMSGYVGEDQRPKPYWYPMSFAQRQAEARRLLAQAGYGPGHPLKLEMKASNTTDTVLIAQAMQADWATVGIDVKFRQEEGQISFQDYNTRDFQVGLASWILDYDDPLTFLALMRSDTGAQNYGDYRNPAYDALLDQADHEADGGRRAQILAKAEKMIIDDADIATVYYGVNRNLVNPNVTGWSDNFGDIHPAKYLCMPPTRGAASGRATAPQSQPQ
ncbi:peptide ABC transporter substrate-binding protein [Caulobacter sp. KR2-114]|uniref:peptide ABC transporter substrate-binding protein n=1 Tax=Caulobacter sp. KR2-114 TaxID=3400912 RepID=UPI003BFCDA66